MSLDQNPKQIVADADRRAAGGLAHPHQLTINVIVAQNSVEIVDTVKRRFGRTARGPLVLAIKDDSSLNTHDDLGIFVAAQIIATDGAAANTGREAEHEDAFEDESKECIHSGGKQS